MAHSNTFRIYIQKSGIVLKAGDVIQFSKNQQTKTIKKLFRSEENEFACEYVYTGMAQRYHEKFINSYRKLTAYFLTN